MSNSHSRNNNTAQLSNSRSNQRSPSHLRSNQRSYDSPRTRPSNSFRGFRTHRIHRAASSQPLSLRRNHSLSSSPSNSQPAHPPLDLKLPFEWPLMADADAVNVFNPFDPLSIGIRVTFQVECALSGRSGCKSRTCVAGGKIFPGNLRVNAKCARPMKSAKGEHILVLDTKSFHLGMFLSICWTHFDFFRDQFARSGFSADSRRPTWSRFSLPRSSVATMASFGRKRMRVGVCSVRRSLRIRFIGK